MMVSLLAGWWAGAGAGVFDATGEADKVGVVKAEATVTEALVGTVVEVGVADVIV